MSRSLAPLVLGLLVVGSLTPLGSAQESAGPKPRTPAPADVRDLGAVGDGQADDTAALQKALAGGGVVELPRGTFRITRTIVIDLDKQGATAIEGHGVARILMAGPGPALKFIGTHEGSADPPTFKPGVLERQRMPMVDGLEIVGAHADAVGIQATGTMQLTVTRTRITECRHGIHLTRRNRNVIISDCHIYKNRGIGVYYDQVDLHQSNIVGSHISYCGGGGVVTRGGAVRNLHIGTCDLESNHDPKGDPTANVLIDSTSSPDGTAEVSITGCTIQHNSQSPDSANIRILGKGSGSGPRGDARWGHVTITGNVLSDVATNIHLRGCRDVTLTGNTFWMGFQHNLLVEECIGLVAGANVMGRNPAYSSNARRAQADNAVIFRNSRDCTITGLEVHAVQGAEAGVLLENCDRFNVTGCTILDCDRVGLLARNLTRSRISDCMIRDDRKGEGETRAASLVIEGGKDLQIVDNMLTEPSRLPARGETRDKGRGNRQADEVKVKREAAGEVPASLAGAFRPPPELAGDFGSYKSPLVFDDGRPVRKAADWPERRREILATWHGIMGAWPPLIDRPKVEVLGTERREDFEQRRVRVEVASDRTLEGYLLVPEARGPRPAVLVVYYEPETAIGKGKELRDFASQLARRGFVTLSLGIDPYTLDPAKNGIKVQPLSYLAYVAANGYNALAKLPEVDPGRVGVMGHSYGGKWAMFASCLFEKFACGVWSDPGIVFDEARSNVNYWDPWYLGFEPTRTRKRGLITAENPRLGAYAQLVEAGHDLHELHALMAPRPFLVSGGAEDSPRRWRPLNHAIAVNTFLGHENRVAMTNRPAHAPTQESNEQIYQFLELVLKPGS